MQNPNAHNKPQLKQNRKELRNNGTSTEATLWLHLKKKQLGGYKFRRQHSVGNFILDFYCPEKQFAIELDGAHHFTVEGQEYYKNRDAYLKEQGITVLHIENKHIFNTPLVGEVMSNG